MSVFDKLRRSQGAKQLSYSIAGDLGASLLGGVATILISRRLGPVSFGQFSAGFALTQILVRVNDLGLSMATAKFIGQAKTQKQTRGFYSLLTKYRWLLSLLIVVIGATLTALVLPLKNRSLMTLAVVVTLATVYFEHLRFTLQALQKIKASSLVNLLQGVAKVSLAGWAFLTQELSVLLIFVLYMLAPGLPVLLQKRFLPGWLRLDLGQIKPKQVRTLHKFLRHSAVSIISAGVVENFDVLLAAYFLSDYQTGLYGGVAKIALFLYVLAYSVGNVLNPKVAAYNSTQLKAYLQKAFLLLAAAGVGLSLALPLSELILKFSIGSEYLPALGVLKILLTSGFISLALMPFQAIFYALDKDWYFSFSGLIQVVIIVGGGVILTPLYGILALAWLRLISRGFLLLLSAGWGSYLVRK